MASTTPANMLQEPSSRPAARAVSAATVPDEHGRPNSSPSASAVRSLDRNCPGVQVDDDRCGPRPVPDRCLRAPRGCGPGAVPAAALPLHQLVLGHLGPRRLQVKDLARSTPVTGRPASPAPHRPQQPGSWRTCRSGRATCASVVPLCPSCPPGFAAGARQPHMRNNTQRPDAAAASARLLPAATAPSGAARYALLDPLRHR